MFVAGVHRQPDIAASYAADLVETEGGAPIKNCLRAEIARGVGQGPYGRYPTGVLSGEDRAGPDFRIADEHRPVLGTRLSAGLEHAHGLVFHPRDPTPADSRTLLVAGWSTNGIVTLSQLPAGTAAEPPARHRQLGCRLVCEMELSRAGGRYDATCLPELRRLPLPG